MGIHNQPCDSLSLVPENWWIAKLKQYDWGSWMQWGIFRQPQPFSQGWWFRPIAEQFAESDVVRPTGVVPDTDRSSP